MKICLYTETALPKIGGQQLVVDALAREMTTQGHEVVVLAQYPRRPLRADDDRQLPYRVVRHPRFLSTWRMVRWYGYWLQKLYRDFPFEVLHCHSVHPCGYVGAVCKDRLKAALVITSHGGDLQEGNVRLQKPGSYQRYEMSLKRADALVSVGRVTSDGFRRFAPLANIVEIPNGVDLKPFALAATRPAALDPEIRPGRYVLFIGRLCARKGVDTLVDAWATSAGNARSDMVLVVAGDGDQRAALAAQTQRLAISQQVHFVGQVMGATKTWLLQNALGVCAPSRDSEAFPLVALEAFAAGKPLIGTRVQGLKDVVTPGRTGWLVTPDSPAELAAALDELASDGVRRHEFSAHARHIAQAHSWEAIAARHVQLYEQLRRDSRQLRAA